MTMKPLIRLTDASRRDVISSRTVLNQANFRIDPGDRIGLIGSSGSGKSSLMRAIALLDPLDSGELFFQGENVSRDAVPRYRTKVVYVAQRPNFVTGSVEDNLRLPFFFQANRSTFDRAVIESWLEELGKPVAMLNQSVDRLSGGEQQIIALIRALSLSPEVLLLDEPTSGLDAELAMRVEQLIKRWVNIENSRAFVWTSHDGLQIERLTTKRFAMRHGSVSDTSVPKIHVESNAEVDDSDG